MSNKRKAPSTKSQSAAVTPSFKNNWIFTGTLDSNSVEKLCLTIFDSDTNLKSDFFEYAIVGSNLCLDSKKGSDLYDVYGYVQIKKHRWTRRELIRHFGVNVTTYSSTELVFGNPEGKLKPNSIVEHIKMICPTHYTEGGELRKRGIKINLKKEDSSDSAEENPGNGDEDLEEEEEVVVESVARRAAGARPNPFIPINISSDVAAAPATASSNLTQRLNIKPSASSVLNRNVQSNINGVAIGKRTVEPAVPPRSSVAVPTRAVAPVDAGSRKEFQFQSPFPGLKNDLCKHLEKFLLSKMDSRFSLQFLELNKRFEQHNVDLDRRLEEHLELIRAEVYKAITDSFGNQVSSENPEEQEDPEINSENMIGYEEAEANEQSGN